jgi:hypothetical protein
VLRAMVIQIDCGERTAVRHLLLDKMKALAIVGILILLASASTFGQVDLSGAWIARNSSDALINNPGPQSTLVDFLGLPLNQFALARALLYSASELSEPERICAFYPQVYLLIGPFSLQIENETELRNGTTISWKIGGWEDRAPMTIWMDGRPHPSANAPHEMTGFSTGTWKDDVLTVYTTHMRAGLIRRNGAPSSDKATMLTRFFRHGDILTVTGRIDDPIYLSEPLYLTRIFVHSSVPAINFVGQPCPQGYEGVPEGAVPHFLPGKNPDLDEMKKVYNIPPEAALGGAETMYPDYQKKLKGKYVPPEKCTRACGGPGGFPLRDQ